MPSVCPTAFSLCIPLPPSLTHCLPVCPAAPSHCPSAYPDSSWSLLLPGGAGTAPASPSSVDALSLTIAGSAQSRGLQFFLS
ncbi:hypothetical protein Nmel_015908 [Mimus melanotis]